MTLVRLEGVSKRFDPDLAPDTLGAVGGQVAAGLGHYLAPKESRYFRELRRGQELPAPGHALDGVDLTVRAGETLAVLGPSGCGKTTLLKIVAGLVEPDAGRVFFNDEDVTSVPAGERGIGMVFQNYALYPHMPGRDNLGFFFKIHRRQEEIPERVRAVSEMMGIGFDQLLSRKPPTLSGGERQRVAVARCIVREPRVFLFDEPLSSLDAKLRAQTRVEIKRLLQRFRITSLYVTHDQTEAIAISDRIAVMRAGRVDQVGTFPEVYGTPANSFVASFVGSPAMNLWTVRAGEGGVELSRLRLPLSPRLRHTPRPGLELLYGVRPEHLAPADDGPLEMVVELSEPLVAERATLAYGKVEGQPAQVRLAGFERPAVGTVLHLGFEPTEAHIFRADNGERLQ